MLQLVCYEVRRSVARARGPQDRESKDAPHVPFGPWIAGTKKSPEDFLDGLEGLLAERHETDGKLLAVKAHVEDARPRLFHDRQTSAERTRIVAISVASPTAPLRRRLGRAIASYTDSCHPFANLWFVATERSPEELYEELWEMADLDLNDEIQVIEIEASGLGAQLRLEYEDAQWLMEHGVVGMPAIEQESALAG